MTEHPPRDTLLLCDKAWFSRIWSYTKFQSLGRFRADAALPGIQVLVRYDECNGILLGHIQKPFRRSH